MTYRMNLKGLERIREVATLIVNAPKIPTQKELADELHVSEPYVSRLLHEAIEDLEDGLPPRRYKNIHSAENPAATKLGVNPVHKQVSPKPRRRDSSQEELDALADKLRGS